MAQKITGEKDKIMRTPPREKHRTKQNFASQIRLKRSVSAPPNLTTPEKRGAPPKLGTIMNRMDSAPAAPADIVRAWNMHSYAIVRTAVQADFYGWFLVWTRNGAGASPETLITFILLVCQPPSPGKVRQLQRLPGNHVSLHVTYTSFSCVCMLLHMQNRITLPVNNSTRALTIYFNVSSAAQTVLPCRLHGHHYPMGHWFVISVQAYTVLSVSKEVSRTEVVLSGSWFGEYIYINRLTTIEHLLTSTQMYT